MARVREGGAQLGPALNSEANNWMEQPSYRSRLLNQYTNTASCEAQPDAPAEARHARWYAHRFRGWLPEDRATACLDVGCGNGMLLRFLASQGYANLSGVDLSPSQVTIAQDSGASVEVGGATEYVRSSGRQWGLITAMNFIEHLTKDEAFAFLDAAWDALVPGGWIILQTPNGSSPSGVGVFLSDLCHELCLTPRSAQALLGASRFANIEFREIRPVPLGLKSAIRWCLDGALRAATVARDLVETGGHSRVLSQVMLMRAQRPREEPGSGA